MADNYAEKSSTAASNLLRGTVTIAEGMPMDDVNNSMREADAQTADFYKDLAGNNTVGGTADALTLTTNMVFASLEEGLTASFQAGSTNTAAATINVDGLGVKALRKNGDTALEAGDILADGIYIIRYDTSANSAAGAWIVINLGGSGGVANPMTEDLDGGGFDLNNMGVAFLTEQASANADVAGKGQFWVETATPNLAKFTDDAGSDFNLIPGYIKLSDVKTSGTSGGTFTSGDWRTRDLNTEDHDTQNNCSLSSNQFTLDAGTYRVTGVSVARGVDRHKLKIRNISDSTDEIIGVSTFSEDTADASNNAFVSGMFTIGSSKTFELQHRCTVTNASTGFGLNSGFSVDEVYSVLELWKVQ